MDSFGCGPYTWFGADVMEFTSTSLSLLIPIPTGYANLLKPVAPDALIAKLPIATGLGGLLTLF